MNTIHWKPGKSRSATTGLNMAWEVAGPESGPPILLIAGLGCQLSMWHDQFCQTLLSRGYRLIRFDNRDIGLTDSHPNPLPINIPLTFLQSQLKISWKWKSSVNYTLELLADDALGLIDALKLERPYVIGISMGGMIAQIMAAKAPHKIKKMAILMSSTNNPQQPLPSPRVLYEMFLKKPKSDKIDDVIEQVAKIYTLIGSPEYPTDVDTLKYQARMAYQRAYRPEGVLRQTHAIMSSGSIEHWTKEIRVPTCVIHGLADPLIKPVCGQRIAQLIKDSEFHMIKGLGHDLPDLLTETIVDKIHIHFDPNPIKQTIKPAEFKPHVSKTPIISHRRPDR